MNFACVCYGIKYKLEYVQKLYNMVQRHTTIPHKFYLFTDHVNPKQQLNGDIIIKQFPMFNLQGWWNKMQLFHPGVLEGTTLYMDLDVVITDNIDCFYNYEPEADFVGMNDFNPDTKIFNSSIMRFKPETMKDKLWQPFIDDRENWLRYSGDQNVISDIIMKHPETKSFPDSWTQSYKWHDRKGQRYHKGKWTFEHNGESLVTVFHGEPNPHQSDMEWVKKAWI
tara:strand:+ start:53 stop:724 length:672 start_codon:yes stop_codon:yes gene_type:complete